MASQVKLFSPTSLLTLLLHIVALLGALVSRSYLFLDYVHVITGGTWTGIDLFMGVVFGRLLRSLDPRTRAEIIKRMVPMMLFLMPALASVATTAGMYLAMDNGILSLSNRLFLTAGAIVLVLIVQGFGLILPNEIRLYMELRKPNPDINKVVRLGMRNIYISGSQVIFQIAVIFVMAELAVQ